MPFRVTKAKAQTAIKDLILAIGGAVEDAVAGGAPCSVEEIEFEVAMIPTSGENTVFQISTGGGTVSRTDGGGATQVRETTRNEPETRRTTETTERLDQRSAMGGGSSQETDYKYEQRTCD